MSDVLEAKSVQHIFDGPSRGKDEPERNAWLDFYIEQGKYNVFTLTVMLTPELATALLARNPSNRKVSEIKVLKYAEDILSGRWEHNGETIVVSNTGELNNGQHRCHAVRRTGKSILTEMTFGVSRESRRTVDTGLKRTVGGLLAIAGYSDSNVLAHAARVVMTFDKHRIISATADIRPTSYEIQNWCDEHTEICDHIAFGRMVRKYLKTSMGLFSGLHYILARVSKEDADTFFERLSTGNMLDTGDPVLQLRNFLVRESTGRKKSPEMDVAAHTIKAWNLFRQKRTVSSLLWRSKKNPDERFPMPE